MPDWLVITIILMVFSPFFIIAIGYLERGWWMLKEKMGRSVECDCQTPQDWSPLGSTYICEDCARKWFSTHDNVAWCGWDWAPWWKRTQMHLGWDRHRKEADPPPAPELQIATPAGRLARLEAKIRSRLR